MARTGATVGAAAGAAAGAIIMSDMGAAAAIGAGAGAIIASGLMAIISGLMATIMAGAAASWLRVEPSRAARTRQRRTRKLLDCCCSAIAAGACLGDCAPAQHRP